MSHSVSVPVPVAAFEGLPQSDDEFDAFIAREGWFEIDDIATIEVFLLRAAQRFHTLDALTRSDASDTVWSAQHDRAWSELHMQFCSPISDLRTFFSEMPGFYELPSSERKRLFQIADLLVGSGRDATRLANAQALSPVFQGRV